MKTSSSILLVCLLVLPLHAVPEAAASPLAVENAEKNEIMHSMIGIRNTLLFYTWNDQKAAVRLIIDNNSTKFPVKGTVYLFDPSTTKEGLAKWLNNQHSDGLFIDAARPTKTVDLPEGSCTVSEHKLLDANKESRNGIFGEYEVTVTVKDLEEKGLFKLKGFKDKTTVFVKQAAG